jgi:hypothetical protein
MLSYQRSPQGASQRTMTHTHGDAKLTANQLRKCVRLKVLRVLQTIEERVTGEGKASEARHLAEVNGCEVKIVEGTVCSRPGRPKPLTDVVSSLLRQPVIYLNARVLSPPNKGVATSRAGMAKACGSSRA